jgi:hypothetical protein
MWFGAFRLVRWNGRGEETIEDTIEDSCNAHHIIIDSGSLKDRSSNDTDSTPDHQPSLAQRALSDLPCNSLLSTQLVTNVQIEQSANHASDLIYHQPGTWRFE